jgi:hypothetical protein
MVTGRVGQSCARTGPHAAKNSPIAAMIFLRFMDFLTIQTIAASPQPLF